MPVQYRKPEVSAQPVQSSAGLSRDQMIAMLIEDTLEPACKIDVVMKDILLNGRKGFNNMTDDELMAMIVDRELRPSKEVSMLPVKIG